MKEKPKDMSVKDMSVVEFEDHLAYVKWLADSRNDVQLALANIYKIMCTTERTDGHLVGIKRYRRFTGLLVGSGFSLWRAIFLINEHEAKQKREIPGHEIDFLRNIIKDNMIGYRQDADCNLWTSRYYINSAVFRLLTVGILAGYVTKEEVNKVFWEETHTESTESTESSYAAASKEDIKDITISIRSLYQLWERYFGENELLVGNPKAPPSKDVWDAAIKLLKLYIEHVEKLVTRIKRIKRIEDAPARK